MQFRDLFNVMALMIRKLIDSTDESFLVKFNAPSSYKEKRLKRKLQKVLPELEICDSALDDEIQFVQKITEVFDGAFEEEDYDLVLMIIQKLDNLLKEEIEIYYKIFADKNAAYIVADKNDKKIDKCLNTNKDECNLQLLPKCACEWSHNSREIIATNTINMYLKNCFYVQMEKLGKFELRNVYLNRCFENAKKTRVLKIGMTPLCNDVHLGIRKFEENGTSYFEIEDVKNEDAIKETVLKQLEQAKENDVDIMMYPEMLGTPDTLNAIRESLEAFNEDEKEYPDLVLCPTVWKDRKNVCVVFDRDGDVIVKQEKQYSFPYVEEGRMYLEGIVPDNTIHLIHCEGVGRIAILICKDALQREYLHMLLECLKVTLVLIPSFSTGSYDFDDMIQMCRSYDCCAVWINTCSASKLKKNASNTIDVKGRFLRAGKATSERKNINLEYKTCKCEEGAECTECIYISELLF